MRYRAASSLLWLGAGALALFLGVRWGSSFFPREASSFIKPAPPPTLYSAGVLASAATDRVFSTSSSFRRVAWSAPPQFSAHAAIIADARSGEVLFNFNPSMRWPLASLTKLITAVALESKISKDQIITLIPEDFKDGSNALTQALEPGDVYTAEDLFKIMLVSSSNEAAAALARVYGETEILALMNGQMADWKLVDTHFADASGIAAGNQSTLNDFKEIITRLNNTKPEILAITRFKEISAVERRTGAVKTFKNINQFASRPDFLGGKTGTTPEAGENLFVLFSFRGNPVMIILYGSENRYSEAESLFNWFTHDFIASN